MLSNTARPSVHVYMVGRLGFNGPSLGTPAAAGYISCVFTPYINLQLILQDKSNQFTFVALCSKNY